MAQATPQLTDAILGLVLTVPSSREKALAQPAERAHRVARNAARTASVISGSLSLPPGVLGWFTMLPELLAVWRV